MKRARLRDGTPIWCDQPLGVDLVWDEMASYFPGEDRVREGDVVFDVGANIGLFSLLSWRQSQGKAHIYSFEPVPSTFAILQANARFFETKETHWHSVRAGLGTQNEIAVLHYFPRMSVLSGRVRDAKQARRELDDALSQDHIGAPLEFANILPRPVRRVLGRLVGSWVLKTRPIAAPIWTLSGALERLNVERVDWLKVDVEGAELDVLRGVDERDWARIARVVCETESLALLEEATALLERAGFFVEVRDNSVIQGQHLKLLFARRV